MWKRLGYSLLSVVLVAAAYFCFQWGFARLSDVRQLDRIPMTPVSALTQGIYAIEGSVAISHGTISAPYSNDKVVYYRFLLEEEYRDSDGNTKTRTLDSGESATAFYLQDYSGRAEVEPGYRIADVNWQARRTHSRKSGDRTYTEYTISEGDSLQLLAYYNGRDKQFELAEHHFNLQPVVTFQTLKAEGGEQLFNASLAISLATGLLAVGLAAVLVAFGIHRYWVFVVIMTAGLLLALWTIGTVNLRKDWDNAAALYTERSVSAIASNRVDALEDLYAMYALIKRSADQWPDSLLFKISQQRAFVPPRLGSATEQQIEARLVDLDGSRYQQGGLVLVVAGVGVLATIVLVWLALRAIRFKRLVEFIPTSKTSGLAYGITELFGMIEVDERKPHLNSWLNKQKCVAYKYCVEERRGSGKNAKWVTLEENSAHTEFWLEDDHGRVLVDPEGANIVYPEKKVEQEGRKRYSEYWLPLYRNIYCLGFAGIANADADKLSIKKSDEFDYLITTQEEDEVVQGKGVAGFMLTGAALGFSLMAGTVLLSGSGMLTPMDLLKVSLMVPATLAIITAILHYNGIVFLKNRVDKTRADIDTLLQRRHDLWPQLLNTVKAHMAHETKLLTAMNKIRSGRADFASNPKQAAQQLAFEKKVVDTVIARVEAYPELKSNRVVQTFSKQMQRTEDELALIRNGYNDSVELYNTQIEKLPDVILAKLFGFKAAALFGRESG